MCPVIQCTSFSLLKYLLDGFQEILGFTTLFNISVVLIKANTLLVFAKLS